jgi:D-beta-D-heptose 7-phosphate kinase/D-beta-D-heptose 1-phosphate adenosyltransferase
VKTRIIARHQQVVRVDRENIQAPTNSQAAKIAAELREAVSRLNAFIFEDYGKGFLSPGLVTQISADLNAAGKIITADPNPHRAIDWGRVTAIKPTGSKRSRRRACQ